MRESKRGSMTMVKLDQEIVVQEDDQWPEKSRENRVKENGKT
jgi:hypothetical protein